MTHSLLVPDDGDLMKIEEPYERGSFALIDEMGADGPAVRLALDPGSDDRFVCFRLAQMPPQNNRARSILALLTGMHFAITGPAIFTGLTDGEITTITEQQS